MSNLSAIGLRGLMALTFTLFLILAVGVLILAAVGEFEALEEVFEIALTWDETTRLEAWRLILSAAFAALLIYALWLIFWPIHQLLTFAGRGDMASQRAAQALRKMGRGMVLLWLSITLVEGILPSVLFSDISPDLEWEISIIGIETVFAICGAALWVVAQLADEAHSLKEEMASIV